MSKTNIPKVEERIYSSTSDQDFTFLDKDPISKYFASEEESIKSLEKLLSKRKTINSIELTEAGITPDNISRAIDKGKAIWNTLNYPAQLTLNL
jgi:hypothetical protein